MSLQPSSYDPDQLIQELKLDEGIRTKRYKDSLGYDTIGVGHLCRTSDPDVVDNDWIMKTLNEDIADAETKLDQSILPSWRTLDPVRQRAMVNLAFNLGYRLQRFVRFLAAMKAGDYHEAADDLMESKWATQVQKSRSSRLIHMIRYGALPGAT